jgi:predicted metal-dependent phosphoesterase TrpH
MTSAGKARGGLVDLHVHTVASDGGDRPDELVTAAAAAGVEVLAVTDHDTVAGVAGARAAGECLGVEVLAGCELTATVGDRVVHVLLYGEGLLAPDLADAVEVARRGRHERNLAIGERLEQLCGVGYDDAVRVAGASALSRAHFARALVARGAVADVAEAFERYLSSGRPAYVPAPTRSPSPPRRGGWRCWPTLAGWPLASATGCWPRPWRPGSTGSRSGTPSTTPSCVGPWPAWSSGTA